MTASSQALLLDSHVLLWWLADVELGAEVREQIATTPTVLVSAASIWEIGIKAERGRLEIDAPLGATIAQAGFRELAITGAHAEAAAALPPHHRDPFDRMLIAQAGIEGASLVSRDRAFDAYAIDLIRC